MSFNLGVDVSRETFERLERYADLVRKWNPRVNLVAKSTLEELWSRHFLDSAQLFQLAPDHAKTWADFGAGGGFPGLVIAILAHELRPDMSVMLAESDARKSAFLRSVVRETAINTKIVCERVEEIPPLCADVISARALANLSKLFSLSHDHLATNGVMLFPKGKNWQSELFEAQSKWRFNHQVVKSVTSDQSVILRISGVRRA
ncbi:16S rRNA (guanine(527)-N(7))-methyltransferase RsmG [Roseovarius sp.]|uniref:16S rRNA (guanine(527)-N(7))-methyltransferase RsmG n=1 Tax=Roseovarius sp. TaxID=1486281 RepID=UPI003B58B9D9